MKIQRDERVILEHTVLGISAPEASILVQNVPKSLAAGVPPQTPLGSLQRSPRPPSCDGLGLRFGNNFLEGKFCAPLLVAGAHCCFEAGYGPAYNTLTLSLISVLQ